VSRIHSLIQLEKNKIEVLHKGHKGPQIVILTGMGCSFDEWYEVIETLNNTCRILTFHRRGLGRSDLGKEVHNTESTVCDLADILQYFKIDEPIYLVGHSYGGLCAQHFVKVYPERVAGVILVDSTSVELKELETLDLPIINEESDESWIKKCLDYSKKDKEELSDIIQPVLNEKQLSFPKAIQQKLLDFQVMPSLYQAMASEIKEWKHDAEAIKNLEFFPDVPLFVIGRDIEFTIESEKGKGIPLWELKKFEVKWSELITDQSKLSSKSELIFASKSGHSVFLDRPDLVIDCVHKMCNARITKV
jgi:pimeloyl-ACP methyl ester carboxylesterase